MGFLSREQIDGMGFAHVVENSRLSDKASHYNYANMAVTMYVSMTSAFFLPELAV